MLVGNAFADAPPAPSHKSNLESIQKEISQGEKQKKSLEKKLQSIESNLDKTRSDLIKLASSIKDNERNLQTLEKRIAALTKEQQDITQRLEKDYGSIAELTLSLERIKSIPPESLIARPGAPLETAQTAMLLNSILPGIYGRAKNLSDDIERLDTVKESLTKDSSEEQKRAASLAKQQKEMSKLLSVRKKLYSSTQADYKKNTAAIERAAKEARSLQDLLTRLDKQQRDKARKSKKPRKKIASIPKIGDAQLPVSGIIRTGYGDLDKIGAKSQGINIESRNGAIVVSPMGGVVRFAGEFKNHGKIIIIEHKKGYHSLVAGLSRIDAVVGQAVNAGEPIGELSGLKASRPVLYYELRYKGEAINPSRKFAELS